MLVLTVAKGPDRGAVFELDGTSRVVIGRNSPDLKLNDIMISRYHARLKLDGGRWIVRDLGSRNGTKLNGERLLKPTILKTGDRIVTGYTEFEVRLAPDAAVASEIRAAKPVIVTSEVETTGAASSAEIDGAADSSEGAASSADLSLNRDEPPAAVAEAAGSAVDPSDINDELQKDALPQITMPDPIEIEIEEPLVMPVLASRPDDGPIIAERSPELPLKSSLSDQAAPEVVAPELSELSEPVPSASAMPVEAAQPSGVSAPSEAIVVEAAIEAATPQPPMMVAEPAISPASHSEIQPAMFTEAVPTEPTAPTVTPPPTVIEVSAAEPVKEQPHLGGLMPLPAVVAESAAEAPALGERAASEWMSAIESQLVVAEGQGWDHLADEEDDGFVLAMDDDVESLDEDQRSLLYYDEDDHWADDVQIDDEELINSLKEDGPEALLAHDLPSPQEQPHRSEQAQPAAATAVKGKKKRKQ